MKSNSRLRQIFAAFSLIAASTLPLSADQIAGSDFSDAAIFNDPAGNIEASTDDLFLTDNITVSGWIAFGTTGFAGGLDTPQFDMNAQGGMPNPPVIKINGDGNNNNDGAAGFEIVPAIGTLPVNPAGVSFDLVIPENTTLNLTNITWEWRSATDDASVRWLAFQTSLDPGVIFSQNGISRDEGFTPTDVDLSGALYQGLTDTTITLTWYAGGESSGDIDFDTIVLNGTVTGIDDADGDDLADTFEQQIIDADPNDLITMIEDVDPLDDFDSDGANNLAEFINTTDPTDEDSDDDNLLDGVETNDGTFDDLATDTGTDPLDPDTDDDGLLDGVETNDDSFDDAATDTGTDPHDVDSDGDTFEDGTEVNLDMTDPNDPNSFFVPDPGIAGSDFSSSAVFDAPQEAGEDLYDNAATSTDDLDPNDSVTVTDWVFSGGGQFTDLDANAQIDMPSDNVTKIDGNDLVQPAVGTVPGADLSAVSFSIEIPAGTFVDLSSVSWVSRQATDTTTNSRWIAFGTSLDPNLVYSEIGSHRNAFDTERVVLSGSQYQGLTNTTVTFSWYAGGTGSGDQDFDTPIVHGTVRTGADPQVTSILYDDTSEPGNVLVTLTFDSTLGQLYTVYTSTDFGDPLLNRGDVTDSLVGEDGSTEYVVDFNAFALPITDQRRFFVIRENDN